MEAMPGKISAVINTFNEERNIVRAINSVKWADEILVCDMHSDDQTAELAKKSGARVISYKRLDYVEPARNFAISKASNEWILVLDPDEEIPESLKTRLIQISYRMGQIDYVRIPRKNIIFGKWIKASMWWPDFNIRFFRKGQVKWSEQIHRPPQVSGQGLDLSAEEDLAILHHNYQTVSQFIDRLNRYTKVQAEELKGRGYKFIWRDLIDKPLNEFLSRFFAGRGYQDGLHGLVLGLLQAFSFLVVYIRLWEETRFREQNLNLGDVEEEKKQIAQSFNYWIKQSNMSSNPFKRFLQKIKG